MTIMDEISRRDAIVIAMTQHIAMIAGMRLSRCLTPVGFARLGPEDREDLIDSLIRAAFPLTDEEGRWRDESGAVQVIGLAEILEAIRTARVWIDMADHRRYASMRAAGAALKAYEAEMMHQASLALIEASAVEHGA